MSKRSVKAYYWVKFSVYFALFSFFMLNIGYFLGKFKWNMYQLLDKNLSYKYITIELLGKSKILQLFFALTICNTIMIFISFFDRYFIKKLTKLERKKKPIQKQL